MLEWLVCLSELYDYCIKEGYADQNLIAKWKKQGYENLCCLRCIQTRDTNFGTNCICRVPKSKLEVVSHFEVMMDHLDSLMFDFNFCWVKMHYSYDFSFLHRVGSLSAHTVVAEDALDNWHQTSSVYIAWLRGIIIFVLFTVFAFVLIPDYQSSLYCRLAFL